MANSTEIHTRNRNGFYMNPLTGALEIYSGGVKLMSGTRGLFPLTPTDVDAQNNTLTVAQIVGGIVVHTSVTGAGTVTTDTAANIIAGTTGGAGALTADGQVIECQYINDGTQTLTFQAGSNVTLADAGQTLAADESATLLFRRTSSTAVTMYVVGA